jgi:hypothetical protein
MLISIYIFLSNGENRSGEKGKLQTSCRLQLLSITYLVLQLLYKLLIETVKQDKLLIVTVKQDKLLIVTVKQDKLLIVTVKQDKLLI